MTKQSNTMKKVILSCILASFFLLSFTLAKEVTHQTSFKPKAPVLTKKGDKGISFFEGSWQDALKKAKEEDKLIFLDAYASWCGPCKLMAKKTFTDEEVGDFFNDKFINFKMDMEKNEEGPRLSKKFQLNAYPSLFFVDGNEEIVHKGLGYLQPDQLMALGEEAVEK